MVFIRCRLCGKSTTKAGATKVPLIRRGYEAAPICGTCVNDIILADTHKLRFDSE